MAVESDNTVFSQCVLFELCSLGCPWLQSSLGHGGSWNYPVLQRNDTRLEEPLSKKL